MSFLDVICSSLGGVVVLLVLFAAMGKKPATPGELSDYLEVEIDRDAVSFEIQDEVSLFLGQRATSGAEGALRLESVHHLEDVAFDDEARQRLYLMPQPLSKYSIALDSEQAKREGQVLGIWLRRLRPETTEPAWTQRYVRQLREGVRVHVRPKDPHRRGVSVVLSPANHFLALVELGEELRVLEPPQLEWTWDQPRWQPPARLLRGTLRDFGWGKYFLENGWGEFNKRETRKATLFVDDPQGLLQNNFVQVALDKLHDKISAGPDSYVSAGVRGIAAHDERGLLLWVLPAWRELLNALLGSQAKQPEYIDKYMYVRLDQAAEQRLVKVLSVRQTLHAGHRDRLADALAHGLSEDRFSPIVRQDPLLLLLRP